MDYAGRVIEIALVRPAGEVLLETLVNPEGEPILPEAGSKHGITGAMAAAAGVPTFADRCRVACRSGFLSRAIVLRRQVQ